MLEAFLRKSFAVYSHLGWGTKQLNGDFVDGWGLTILRFIEGWSSMGYLLENPCIKCLGLFYWSFHIFSLSYLESKGLAAALQKMQGLHIRHSVTLSLFSVRYSGLRLCLEPLSPQIILPSPENKLATFHQGRERAMWNEERGMGI